MGSDEIVPATGNIATFYYTGVISLKIVIFAKMQTLVFLNSNWSTIKRLVTPGVLLEMYRVIKFVVIM